MTRWIPVADEGEIPDGRGRAVTAGDLRLALFRDGDGWHALDEACPHQGASLADGPLHEGRVICPLHAWVFDVTTGRCPRDSHDGVRVYPTRRRDGRIEVGLPDQEGPSA